MFYLLDAEDKTPVPRFHRLRQHACNCNHPLVTQFLLECLTFWVREMHVDGFRFDLASVLSRGADGEPLADPPVVASIEFAEAL